MKFNITFFILFGSVVLTTAQTRCFTYDAAGNRTTRVSCVLAIQNTDDEDEIMQNVVSSITNDVGGSTSDVRDQLLSNDISPLVIYPNPSSGVSHMLSGGGTVLGIDFGGGIGFANTNGNYKIYMLSVSIGYTGSPLNLTGSYFYNQTFFDK